MSQVKLKNFQISSAMKGIESSKDDFIASVLRSRLIATSFLAASGQHCVETSSTIIH